MDEKRKRLHEALDEACDHGLGEFNIKIKEDGHFFIQDIRWKKNPLKLDVDNALDIAVLHAFGGLEIEDGNVVILKQLKKIRF